LTFYVRTYLLICEVQNVTNLLNCVAPDMFINFKMQQNSTGGVALISATGI